MICLCMRTSIDLPDSLMDRAKRCMIERKVTFRALVISALEQAVAEDAEPFVLHDAAAGTTGKGIVSCEAINQAIDDQRATSIQP
jgi:hypothetical protein